jgi:hypothetical protein
LRILRYWPIFNIILEFEIYLEFGACNLGFKPTYF